jgi:hypothetical protein
VGSTIYKPREDTRCSRILRASRLTPTVIIYPVNVYRCLYYTLKIHDVSKIDILLYIFNLSLSPLENGSGDRFFAPTLLEVGEVAHGKVEVEGHREG